MASVPLLDRSRIPTYKKARLVEYVRARVAPRDAPHPPQRGVTSPTKSGRVQLAIGCGVATPKGRAPPSTAKLESRCLLKPAEQTQCKHDDQVHLDSVS